MQLTYYCLNSFFVVFRDIGSFRLLTHSRDAHRKFFFMIPSYFRIEILALKIRALLCALGSKGLYKFVNFHFLWPLLPEFFLSSFFGTGSFSLPTHSRDAHRKFFLWSLLILGSKCWHFVYFCAHWALKG